MLVLSSIPTGHATIDDVSWHFYENFLKEFEERSIRHTYDDGVLEIMSPPGFAHERPKKMLSWLIQELAVELRIPIACLGSMTLKSQRKLKGIEPDECFYVAHEAEMRSKDDYDAEFDPPPDLAIEIDWTNSSIPRLPVYARLGVPEIWRYAKRELTVHLLNSSGEYEASNHSLAFPMLPLQDFSQFIVRDPAIDETTWILQFRQWVRETCAK